MPDQPWVQWARERDATPTFEPVKAPEPRPPVEARPKQLSVTRIERWIANPYEIFARHILKLEPMQELGKEPDAAMRGTDRASRPARLLPRFPDALPADIEAELIRVADAHFAKLDGSPLVKAFWRPQLRRFARWFAATEPSGAMGIARILTEVNGALPVGGGFTLTARADRIDVAEDGSVVIYDYKTGKPPGQKHVDELYAPQLPLEAAIAAGGGFEGLGERAVNGLRYIHVSGRDDGGEERDAAKTPAVRACRRGAGQAERSDRALCRSGHALRGEAPQRLRSRRAYDYDEYEHLARVKEWLTQEAEEDFR